MMLQKDDPTLKQPEIIDIGHVGEVESIDPSIVTVLDEKDFIPVIAPIGVDKEGNTYNINADTVAGKLAITLDAERLMLLTNTPGVLDKEGEVITGLREREISELIQNGTIAGGMLPKVQCALDAIRSGVRAATIVDGRVEHSVLLELLTVEGVGTQIKR